MTNREQVAWAFGFGDYDDSTVAEIVSDMVEAVGSYLGVDGRRNLEKWLSLDCDPKTNNWGVLEDYITAVDEDLDADQFFPNLDKNKEWEKTEEGSHIGFGFRRYRFLEYGRKSNC